MAEIEDVNSNEYYYNDLDYSAESEEGAPLQSLLDERPRLSMKERLSHVSFVPRQLCLPSKSAILLLVWTWVLMVISITTKGGTSFAINGSHVPYSSEIVFNHVLYTLTFFLYPLAGFIADVYYGYYRLVSIGLCSVLCGTAVISMFVSFPLFFAEKPFNDMVHYSPPFYIFSVLGLLLVVVGISVHNATIFQFGLDQLFESPSEYMGLFVHWMVWFQMFGVTSAQAFISVLYHCSNSSQYKALNYVLLSLPFALFAIVSALLIFTYCKRHWFYTEPLQSNPYNMVVKVLNFARKHKHPLQRSAFTYTDEEIPSRIDFAKEKFGGPFTTEQVENVKSLFRILVVLLSLVPVLVTEIPVESVLPIFIKHIIKKEENTTLDCDWKGVMTDAYVLKSLVVVISFPVYIWFIYSVLRKCIPGIFIRLWVGIVTLLVGFLFIFLIEILSHYLYYKHHGYGVVCMFSETKNKNYEHHLYLPWAMTLVPLFLTEIGLLVTITTGYEFISAQTPRSMKSLIFGVMFALRALVKVTGSIIVLPFSAKAIWRTERMMNSPPPVINCGFGYFLLVLSLGLIGIVLFSVIAKRYKYRQRNDPPFNQLIVERVWENG